MAHQNRRQVLLLDAPSNLGLRPPLEGSIPGCYKLGWALREAGLTRGVEIHEAGVVVPPRYEARWEAGQGDRNAEAIATYSTKLADRLRSLVSLDAFPVVLGGDCSVLIGAAMAVTTRGRFGVAFLDGHSDFRHPGNDTAIGAAAGEDLAIITGRGDSRLIDLEGLGPYVLTKDVVAVGMRTNDPYTAEMRELGISTWPVDRLRDTGVKQSSEAILARLADPSLTGFWIHLDVDILDPEAMPAVDTPSPGGLELEELTNLLVALAVHPRAAGMDVCIFDPDLDPEGRYAETLVRILQDVLHHANMSREHGLALE